MTLDAGDNETERALAALLDWYVAIGVDLALDEAPHDRFAEHSRAPAPEPEIAVAPDEHPALEAACELPAPRPRPAAPSRAAAPPPVFPEEAARAAQVAAAGAETLEDLQARLMAFEGCGLKRLARHFLFGAGAPGARVMVFDIAPGEEEERNGAPFIGPAARLLDNMLAAIGLDREGAYLVYFSPWRPAAGDQLPAHEIAALAPFARRHVELARPDFLLLLGDPLARALLDAGETGSKLYGRWFENAFGPDGPRAVALPRLGAMLNTPTLKRSAWKGLRLLAQATA